MRTSFPCRHTRRTLLYSILCELCQDYRHLSGNGTVGNLSNCAKGQTDARIDGLGSLGYPMRQAKLRLTSDAAVAMECKGAELPVLWY